VELAELQDWCSESLPRAALPRQVIVVDQLPHLGSGKVDRLAVQQIAIAADSARRSSAGNGS
jgi:acyl-coenzyme A synthetase/AMP-(fatty) acid ligase